jgi:hypothetical protein
MFFQGYVSLADVFLGDVSVSPLCFRYFKRRFLVGFGEHSSMKLTGFSLQYTNKMIVVIREEEQV